MSVRGWAWLLALALVAAAAGSLASEGGRHGNEPGREGHEGRHGGHGARERVHQHEGRGHEGHDHASHDHAGHDHDRHALLPSLQKRIEPSIPDTVLIDQNGVKHRFYTDLIKGKTVLMNGVYTSCPGVCPIQTSVFARVQALLGDRVGNDVQMISVSIDPVTDTPQKLKKYAEKFHVKPGWLFLTGPRQDVAEVLRAMDLYSAVPSEHTPIAAVGYEPGAVWMKMINITAPSDIVGRLDYVRRLGEARTEKQ